MIHCKNFCNCHNVPQYNNNLIRKTKLKKQNLKDNKRKGSGSKELGEGEMSQI
jgi:hypothetical protein